MSIPLSEPSALDEGTLRVIPIGGLGEIGRNMTMFEYDGEILIVDCGVLFPEEHQRGVGPFDLEFVAVNHSIPDALAVAIRTPAGMVLATGDFKMDQLPLD